MVLSRGQRVAILLAGLLLCSLLVGVAGIAGGSRFTETLSPSEAGVNNIESESFEADRTVFIITVRENGSAEWRFRYEQRLESDAEIENFRTYADRFNTEETDSFVNFRERAATLTTSGSEATGREMAAERFRRDARLEERPPAGDEFAVIEMSFEWPGFAVIDNGEVVVGDVFIGGLYVAPDQQLRFKRGPNLQFESATPDPDSTAAETLTESETITWIGEQSFADRQPRVAFVERESDATPTETDPETEAPASEDAADPGIPFVTIGIVIFLGLATAVAYRAGLLPTGILDTGGLRSRETAEQSVDTEAETQHVSGGAKPDRSTVPEGERPNDGTAAVTDEQFLSDEERVITLLEAQGGRMKQVDIVDRTDWSKSKVSMLLSEMESEGTISKLRVGRENIVSLAGHEPDAVGSPFDNE